VQAAEPVKTIKPATDEERKILAQLARRELAKHGILFSAVTGREYELRGANKQAVTCTDPQFVIAGPADCGKTVALCLKLHSTALLNPNSQHVMARKVYGDMVGSVLQTFGRIASDSGVMPYGGEKPQWFDYPNGSRIWLCGMDNPGKALSSERDSIYINQAEQFSRDDWETLSTRTTGRNAVVKHAQIYGDCNPGGSRHWIKEMAKEGKLTLLVATHKDNPTLYDEHGVLTPGGHARLAALEKLTGLRRKRLFEGAWATAEGAVYEMFDANIHVLLRDRREFKWFYLAMDEGYTNPATILDVGEDADGRWHVFREFYQTGQLQETIVKTAKQWAHEQCRLVAVDESAAGLIADLLAIGLPARGGKGRVLDGINRIQNRLAKAGDGKPRLTIDPSCVNLTNEFESYCWRPEKDVPVKEFDHALDALRYLEDVLAEPSIGISLSDIAVGGARTDPGGTGRSFTPRRLAY
jgi:PBSX family phage terminase large subunit